MHPPGTTSPAYQCPHAPATIRASPVWHAIWHGANLEVAGRGITDTRWVYVLTVYLWAGKGASELQ